MNGTLSHRARNSNNADSSNGNENDNLSLSGQTTLDLFFARWKKHSLLLENRGLVARDHLANERTYLAWTRTALVMMTRGLAFLQLYSIQLRAHEAVYKGNSYALENSHGVGSLRAIGKPLGVLAGVFLLVTMVIGFYRYLLVQLALRKGEFPATRFLAIALLLMGMVLMTLILVLDVRM